MKAFLKVFVFSLSILFCTSALAAETFKDEAAMRRFADDFMKKIGGGDIPGAYDFLKPYASMNSIDVDSAGEETRQIRQKFAMRYGPSNGYQFISEKKVADSIYRLLYIEKAEKKVLPWYFIFYKAGDTWRLDEFDWTERVSVLFPDN